MFINKVLTCNGGWEKLTLENPDILSEITEMLQQVSPENLLRKPFAFKDGVITPMAFHRLWDSVCRKKNWHPQRIQQSEAFYLYMRAVKAKISIRINASDATQFPNWLFVETQRSFDLGVIDFAILLVPMDNVNALYGDENRMVGPRAFVFSAAKAHLDELQPLRTVVPLVVLGFSQHPQEIEVQEIDTDLKLTSKNLIERSIEFKPEQYQAGMSILAYFGKVLEQKHPGVDVKVRIEQDKNLVRMHIETPDGMKSVIEKTLEEYSLVISNRAAPETLFDNKLQILQLQNKLDNAVLEVKQTREILQLTREMYQGKVSSLEDDVKFLRNHLGLQLSNVEGAHRVITTQAKYHRDVVVAQIEFTGASLETLIKNYSSDIAISQSLELIKQKLENGLSDKDKNEIDAAVQVIASTSPSLLSELGEAVRGTAYGVTGNMLYQWLLPAISMIG